MNPTSATGPAEAEAAEIEEVPHERAKATGICTQAPSS